MTFYWIATTNNFLFRIIFTNFLLICINLIIWYFTPRFVTSSIDGNLLRAIRCGATIHIIRFEYCNRRPVTVHSLGQLDLSSSGVFVLELFVRLHPHQLHSIHSASLPIVQVQFDCCPHKFSWGFVLHLERR